jgi:AcrR family transcriptional regulator
MIQNSNDRALRRQQRTVMYFVDAARDIIKKEGTRAATIRSVSDLAGYTSATLYNYFDNLNHIISLATMNYLDAYASEAPKAVSGLKKPADVYLAAAGCFFRHSFENPEIFEILFVDINGHKLEKYMEQYYSIYPEITRHSAKLIFKPARPYQAGAAEAAAAASKAPAGAGASASVGSNASYLADLVQKGVMTEQAADDFNDIALMIYKCLLREVSWREIDKDAAYDRIMRLYGQQIGFYASQA